MTAGGGFGFVRAIQQISAQRAYMLEHWGWVCATDWPLFVITNVVLGVAAGRLLSGRLTKIAP